MKRIFRLMFLAALVLSVLPLPPISAATPTAFEVNVAGFVEGTSAPFSITDQSGTVLYDGVLSSGYVSDVMTAEPGSVLSLTVPASVAYGAAYAEAVVPADGSIVVFSLQLVATPTPVPTAEPVPTVEPTLEPTLEPTVAPTIEPTIEPTTEPTELPTEEPVGTPTVEPTTSPTPQPTATPKGTPAARVGALALPAASVSPESAEPGTVVRITGSGFLPGETVAIEWDWDYGQAMGWIVAPSDGNITGRVTIPRGATPGFYYIVLRGDMSGTSTYIPFTVDGPAAADVSVTPSSGSAGDIVRVSGNGFVPGESVDIYWDNGTYRGSVTANTSGFATGRITIPATARGTTYDIEMTGTQSGRSGSTSFTVIGRPPAEFWLESSAGDAGDIIRFYGTGFVPGERVNIMWSGDSLMGYVFATADGQITGRVKVPVSAYMGLYSIEAQAVTSGEVATTTFEVLSYPWATATVSPSSGRGGDVVSVTASGFLPGERVDIYWDGSTYMGTMTVASTGAAKGRVTIPRSAYQGGHWITFQGEWTSQFADAFFTVTSPPAATLAVSPTSGAGGVIVRVTGSGYQPGEYVSLYWDVEYGTYLGATTANSYGAISARVTIPRTAYKGAHKIVASGWSVNPASASYTVTVAPAAVLTLSPTSGLKGFAVWFEASGFVPGETVTIRWDSRSGTSLGSFKTSSNGVASGTVYIPSNATTGTHYLYAVGGTNGQVDDARFVVTAPSYPSVPPASSDLNCSDFKSWQAAQDYLHAYPWDPSNLDADNDGEACDVYFD